MLIDLREKGKEGERDGEKCRCERRQLVASYVRSDQGLNLQPWHVP